jgi:hypothetical protein
LLGEPTFFPHATEAVWTLAEDRSVYVVEHVDGAGNSAVTIFVDDLDAEVAAIAARGLEADERLTHSNGVRKVLYRDPDGNELGSAARRSNPVHSAPVPVRHRFRSDAASLATPRAALLSCRVSRDDQGLQGHVTCASAVLIAASLAFAPALREK